MLSPFRWSLILFILIWPTATLHGYVSKYFPSHSPSLTFNINPTLGIKFFFEKIVKILLVLIIFYKMNTDNDALLKFWFHLVI